MRNCALNMKYINKVLSVLNPSIFFTSQFYFQVQHFKQPSTERVLLSLLKAHLAPYYVLVSDTMDIPQLP